MRLRSSLHVAARQGATRVCAAVLGRGDFREVNARDEDGWTQWLDDTIDDVEGTAELMSGETTVRMWEALRCPQRRFEARATRLGGGETSANGALDGVDDGCGIDGCIGSAKQILCSRRFRASVKDLLDEDILQ